MRKYLPLAVVVALASLVFILGLLSYRYFILKPPSPSPEEETPELINEVINKPDIPITKSFYPESEGVLYELTGKIEGLGAAEEREDGAFSGNFILEGDELNRKIPILLFKSTLFGIYNGSFNGNSNWKESSPEAIQDELETGEAVRVQVSYPVIKGQPKPDYVLELEEVLDTLSDEYKFGEFTYQIPSDFRMVVTAVGVVR